jgi:hypothetical protein
LINQVERWFGFRTDQLLKCGVRKALSRWKTTSAREWIATWNAAAGRNPFATGTVAPGHSEERRCPRYCTARLMILRDP